MQSNGINMSYDFIENKVYFDPSRLQQALFEMDQPVTVQQYIQTLTLHELGHALDRQSLLDAMPKMIEIAKVKRKKRFVERREDLVLFAYDMQAHEMDLAFEETAWENAKKLNERLSLISWDVFERVETQGMASYRKLYEKDAMTYKKLLAASLMAEREAEIAL